MQPHSMGRPGLPQISTAPAACSTAIVPGSAVKVHYDPSRPGMAVLQTGHTAVLRPMHIIASTAAIYTVFTIGMAIAAVH